VQGPPPPEIDLAGQRRVVEAFIAALRAGDVEGLIAVLDPDVVVSGGGDPSGTREVRGARTRASGAIAYAGAMHFARPALVDGAVGLVMAPNGRLLRVLRFTFAGGKIAHAEVIADRALLDALEIAPLR
jgi:hypothetical protein